MIMGHIKEPKGVDFVIASDPLTDIARQEISEFIRNYRNKNTLKKLRSKKRAASNLPKQS
jgi:hypothetical protein